MEKFKKYFLDWIKSAQKERKREREITMKRKEVDQNKLLNKYFIIIST